MWAQEKQNFLFATILPLYRCSKPWPHLKNAADLRSVLRVAECITCFVNKFAICNSLFMSSEPSKLHAPKRLNTTKVGSFQTGLYPVHDSFTTLVSSQSHSVYMQNLSHTGFLYSKWEDSFEQFKAECLSITEPFPCTQHTSSRIALHKITKKLHFNTANRLFQNTQQKDKPRTALNIQTKTMN